MSADKPQTKHCLNCGHQVDGNYCQHCGQSTSVHRITFRETFDSFLSSNFALEGPLIRTIKLLALNPGKVFREFLEGRRKTYYKPVAFFILLTAIYIIIRALLDYDPLLGQVPNEGREDLPRSAKKSMEAARFMVANINNIMFFLVFGIGLMLKAFFRKRYNLAEYTSVAFYITGMYTIFGMLMMVFNNYTGYRFNQVQLVVLLIYVVYCCHSFLKPSSFWSFIKYILVGVFGLLLYMIFGYGFSLLIVLLK